MTSSTINHRYLFRLARQLMLGVMLLVPMAAALGAGTGFEVTNTNDSGPGSLRQAMLDALADPDPNEITFAASADGVITLESPLPDLLQSGGALTVIGNGVESTVLDGDGQFRFFHIAFHNNLTLSLQDMTLRNGRAEGSQGGAIRIVGSNNVLNIDTVRFLTNSSSFDGGAIQCECDLNIENSTFSGNSSGAFGGALSINTGTVLMRNSTLFGHQATSGSTVFGDGDNVDIRLVNVTITGNQTPRTILSSNNAGLSMSNTLVADNGTGVDLDVDSGGTFEVADSFNNIIGSQSDDAGFVDGENGNMVGVDNPRVGPLGDYGGPTPTAPLLPGSPAIDAGTGADTDVPALDQRGVSRVGTVDIGAFESRGFNLTLAGGDNQSTRINTGFADPLAFAIEADAPAEPVEGGVVSFAAPATGASAALSEETATIDAAGTGQVLATANGTIGGPYPVTASTAGADSIEFALTNTPPPGVTVDPVSGLVTTEAGGSDTFTVVLEAEPTADVTIPVASSNAGEGTVNPASLVFTGANWNTPQTVIVTGVDDDIVDGDQAYTILVEPANSADAGYDGFDPDDVSVTNIDNNAPGTTLAGTKEIAELDLDAGTVSYLITLTNVGDDVQPDDPKSDEFVDSLPAGLALTAAAADAGDLNVDLAANTVTWNGELPAGDGVTIMIDADIFSDQTGAISNQGQIHFDSNGDGSNDAQALTDDPNLPGNSDPTSFQIQGTEPAIPIPAASLPVWLLLAGSILLLGIGARHRQSQRP